MDHPSARIHILVGKGFLMGGCWRQTCMLQRTTALQTGRCKIIPRSIPMLLRGYLTGDQIIHIWTVLGVEDLHIGKWMTTCTPQVDKHIKTIRLAQLLLRCSVGRRSGPRHNMGLIAHPLTTGVLQLSNHSMRVRILQRLRDSGPQHLQDIENLNATDYRLPQVGK